MKAPRRAGVKKEYHDKGADPVMTVDAFRDALKHGVRMAESSPEPEASPKIGAAWKHVQPCPGVPRPSPRRASLPEDRAGVETGPTGVAEAHPDELREEDSECIVENWNTTGHGMNASTRGGAGRGRIRGLAQPPLLNLRC